MASDFKDLIVWKKSMDLVEITYGLVKAFPREEQFELASQMRRAAVSIPSNIAEGQGRKTDREFLRFLSIARGSRAELETQLLLAQRLGYLSAAQGAPALSLSSEIGKMLFSLSESLQATD